MVSNCVGQSKIVVSGGGNVPVLHQGVVNVPVKGPFDFVDIVDLSNAPHADLFSFVHVAL